MFVVEFQCLNAFGCDVFIPFLRYELLYKKSDYIS